ncbi:MAG: glycosyltransferase [Desulforhopalus sp.]|nr:glycosyltransferase [Desulforhopalus sp.]
MRILHVANFNLRKYGADLYATDRKISAGLIGNGHFVYDFSYRDVCRNESIFRTTRLGKGQVNRKLLKACATIAPHLLLLGHSELIEAATLAEIKRRHPSMKIGLWYVDALFHRDKTTHLFERLAHIDVVFATTGGEYLREYATATTTAAFIPNIIDPAVEVHKAFLVTDYDYDFIFCGRDENDQERQDFMTTLNREASKTLRCAFRGCLGNPPVTGAAYLDFIGRSKMALNISRRNDVAMYSSDRLAQLTGNGLLTFCPRVPGMERLFRDDQIVYFDTLDDLLEKIVYYHNHDGECRTIAERGWQRAHRSFNGARVCRYMLELLFDTPFSANYEWLDEVYPRS